MTLNTYKLTVLALMLTVVTGCQPADNSKPQTTEGSIPAASTPETKPADKPKVTAEKMSLKQPQNQQLLVRLLNGVYGSSNYDAKNQCWRQTLHIEEEYRSDTLHYCMAVARLDKITIEDKTQWYVQMSGNEKTGSHAVMGAMGFFIFSTNDESIIAAKPLEKFDKEFGEGPSEMALLQLSPSGHFGWLGTGMVMHPDVYAEPAVLMTLKDKSIINILGNLPYTNGDNQQLVKYSYRIDSASKAAPLYQIIVSEKNTENGKQHKFTAHFDRKRWEYRCRDKRCIDVRS